MSKAILPIIFAVLAVSQHNVAVGNYIEENTEAPIETLTTNAGAPVEYRDTSTLNSNFIANEYAMDDVEAFVRERIPERVVHAHGSGAFGYFETTHDISHICKAKLFSKVGKKTPVGARFSLSISRSGVRDTVRENRGAGFKFYTEEGNFDLLGFNTPVSGVKDPAKMSSLIHAGSRNPASNLPDANRRWDFLSNNPESIFAVMYALSDYGTPAGYRHMPVFPIHTFQVYNKHGVSSYLKFHILPVLGIKNYNVTEVAEVNSGDADLFARDLYNAIDNGENAQWYLKAQILSEKDRKMAKEDIFDVTQILPLKKYPLHQIGIITLNKNPINYFAEMEQIAFSPGNMVPGIRGSPDKLFEARCMAYRDAAMYRLGANFKKIPVNCPIQTQVHNYNRDGRPPVNDNGRNESNYISNSFGGPVPQIDAKRPQLIKIYENQPNNFKQAGEFYTDVLRPEQRISLVNNMVATLCPCQQFIIQRALKSLRIINSDFGKKVTEGLAAKCPNVQ